ncbi:hypothetical protein RUM44_002331 [Polyplax serrata]|uniref:Cytosol aminopeptidase domain-containing protein n=1 Tax=Polyplax serrata TaxID=468196 RepID=A0ABR1AMX0_POLSC
MCNAVQTDNIHSLLGFPLKVARDGLSSPGVDGIIYVSSDSPFTSTHTALSSVLKSHEQIDNGFNSNVSVIPVNLPAEDGIKVIRFVLLGRLVYSPVSNLSDYDDVRSYSEAAARGVKRALKAGLKDPLLVLPKSQRFAESQMVTLLGALETLYVPIQIREDVPEKKCKIKSLTVWSENENSLAELLQLVEVLESGRVVSRDIGSGDPERMAAPRVEEYVRKLFENSHVSMTVVSDLNVLAKEYPLFAAVNRAASVTPRHHGRIIYLTYEPEGQVTRTLGVVGKGITYDTGGADIKTNGIMVGMSRDKCGAAAVAGLMHIVSKLRPNNIRVIGAMCLARNSAGENAYVADEVITARSKARVRVNNTDAEGRMVMADVLCKVKEDVLKFDNVHLVTIATLTGHAVRSVGPYTIAMDNSVAKTTREAYKLQEAGNEIGDPLEVSVIRREDFAHHKGSWEGDDVNQCNKESASKTQRGHQGPAAFLIMASGLDKHGLTSSHPLSYSHLDIAGSAGDIPLEPTASPVLTLYSAYIKEYL